MRTLTTLVLIACLTLACHDARVSNDRRTEEEKKQVQATHKKEMKEATEAYRSMKISDMADQKKKDEKSPNSAEDSNKESKVRESPGEQKRQP
jgi:hypothetical protein